MDHGTYAMYRHGKCRCDECFAAARDSWAASNARRREAAATPPAAGLPTREEALAMTRQLGVDALMAQAMTASSTARRDEILRAAKRVQDGGEWPDYAGGRLLLP